MATPLTAALRSITQDRRVTQGEWDSLAPLAEQTPKRATAEAREVLAVWADDTLVFDQGVRSRVDSFLDSRGYDTGMLPFGIQGQEKVQFIIERNVSELDQAFEDLSQKAGRGVETAVVAVLDGGFDLTHPVLADRLWTNPGEIPGDGIDNDGNHKVDDVSGWDFRDGDADPSSRDSGHGLHVLGLATKGTDRVDGMPVRLQFDPTPQEFVDAIDHAVALGARVVNMSFKVQTEEGVSLVKAAMARHPDVLFVKSAGNDFGDVRTFEKHGYPPERFLPANRVPNMAVVAGTDTRDGNRMIGSNWGAPFVTHAAPGNQVLSLRHDERYANNSGTSMAVPSVSNLAAKLLILDEGLSPENLKELMSDTSDRSANWTDWAEAGGPVNPKRAYALAALTGLVRRGSAPEAAAAQLGFSQETSARLLPLASKYVRAA